jgi:hypothetical protein
MPSNRAISLTLANEFLANIGVKVEYMNACADLDEGYQAVVYGVVIRRKRLNDCFAQIIRCLDSKAKEGGAV